MAEDKFEQAKGNIKETVGNATDNKELEKDGNGHKPSNLALMYSMVYEGLFVYISK